jgi:DUF1009 family protein
VTPKLGILAGGGDLPRTLATACAGGAVPYHVIAIESECDPEWPADHPHDWSPLGALGRGIGLLHEAGCAEVVLAGSLTPPSPTKLKTDARGAKVLAKIALRGFGADAALRILVAELEGEGFRVVGPEAVLAELLAPAGVLGRHRPGESAWDDIRVAERAAREIGRQDIGQAAVAHGGEILVLEDIEGTDAMVARAREVRSEAQGGVLVKVCKPGQERRVDLPAIGPATVDAARAAGLDGIAVEAGRALIVDREAVLAKADQAGIFVVGIDGHEDV